MYFKKGVWYDQKQNKIVVITKAEWRNFINIKTFETSEDWVFNCYVPQYERLLRGVRFTDHTHLVYIGAW